MSCPSGNTPIERIYAFSARYVLNGDYTATVELLDADCLDSAPCTGFCQPVQAGINTALIRGANTSSLIPTSVKNCYNTSPNWINGLMNSYARSESDFSSVYDVTSYFEYLKNKAISTQQLPGVLLSTVLPTVIGVYAGVPNSLLDIVSYDNNFIKGPIEGNNLWDELQSLAQAGCADLFVQVGGKLTIEKWKDHTSPVELVIPDSVMISAEKAKYTPPNTTAIRAKGASITGFTAGTRTLSNNEQGPGAVTKCVQSGLKTPVVELTFNNLTGSEEDLRNAQILASNFNVFRKKAKIKGGGIQYIARNLNPSEFFGPTPKGSLFVVSGTVRSDIDEKLNPRATDKKKNSKRDPSNVLQNALNYGYPVPMSSFGKGAFGSESFVEPEPTANSPIADRSSPQQVETVLYSPKINVCGFSTEEIDNKYIFSRYLLVKLAARRYQEIILSQNVWNVDIAYYPCIKLNQVVEFNVPETKNCGVKKIKGIVAGIDVSHSTADDGTQETSMSLSIMDVSCLGGEVFFSENLVVPISESSNLGLTGWAVSPTTLFNQSSVEDCIFLSNSGGLIPAFAQFTFAEVEVGTQYSWSFDYISTAGGSSTNFIAVGFPGTTVIGGSGTHSGTFTATQPIIVFRWILNLLGGGRKSMVICNFNLSARRVV